MKPSAAVIKLALEIADSAARSDVECHCTPEQPSPPWFWNLDTLDDVDREGVMLSVHYLELRGLIKHDAERPHVVTFPEEPAS